MLLRLNQYPMNDVDCERELVAGLKGCSLRQGLRHHFPQLAIWTGERANSSASESAADTETAYCLKIGFRAIIRPNSSPGTLFERPYYVATHCF
jgi:hypothetical protein